MWEQSIIISVVGCVPLKKQLKKMFCRYNPTLMPPGIERSRGSPQNIVLNHLERKEIKVFSFTESV